MRDVYHIPQDPKVNAWAAFFAVILVGAMIAVGIWIWQTGNHHNGKADNQTNAPTKYSDPIGEGPIIDINDFIKQ